MFKRAKESCIGEKRLRGDTSPVETGPSDPVPLNERDPGSQLGSPDRCHITPGSTPNDHNPFRIHMPYDITLIGLLDARVLHLSEVPKMPEVTKLPRVNPKDAKKNEMADMGMLFGKASGRTFKRFGTTIRFRNRNPLKVKSSDTHPFLIKSPSEALERSIPMATFCNRRVKKPCLGFKGV